MAEPIIIREATPGDVETIAQFNAQLAEESEAKALSLEILGPGVAATLADSSKGRYFVACDGERIVGQTLITYEWSDWRNGMIWWIQSVYVEPGDRRRGVFRALYEHIETLGRDQGVVGLRLYVHHTNTAAQHVYRQLGMSDAGYHVLEKPIARGLSGRRDA